MAGFFQTLTKTAYRIFGVQDQTNTYNLQPSMMSKGPTRQGSHRSRILDPLKARISVDVAGITFHHVLLDEDQNYVRNLNSRLEQRLTLKANVDQTSFSFVKDAVDVMLDYGAVAIVPCDVTNDPLQTTGYDILSVRCARILEHFTQTVAVNLYNDATGTHERLVLPKSYVAICYNPMHRVMNDENSTLNRLVQKLSLLDRSDNRFHSSSLDLILQLPFAVRNEKRQEEAGNRIQMIENQLSSSQFGVAYIDSTEKITQLNRSVASSLPEQVAFLKTELYNQLGLTPAVLDGTATPEQMELYYSRTIEPIIKELSLSMTSSLLSATAVTQGQAVRAYMPLFKMAPVGTIATAADLFTRNEIMTPGEVRAAIGMKKAADPTADELRNRNITKSTKEEPQVDTPNNDL